MLHFYIFEYMEIVIAIIYWFHNISKKLNGIQTNLFTQVERKFGQCSLVLPNLCSISVNIKCHNFWHSISVLYIVVSDQSWQKNVSEPKF